jgi:hypothetical protein
MTVTRDNFSIHLLLCGVAFAIGVFMYANIIHVNTLHQAAAWIIGIVAVLSAF